MRPFAIWTAPAEQSGNGAFASRWIILKPADPKRRRRFALPAQSILLVLLLAALHSFATDDLTPLLRAADADDFKTAKSLVESGANVSATNRYGVAPLSVAWSASPRPCWRAITLSALRKAWPRRL